MRVVISEFMSLDGIVQAPGGATEDVSGGFQHGGWSMKFFDPDVMGAVVEGFAERNEVLLQGRRTYQVSAEAWPGRSGGVRRLDQRGTEVRRVRHPHQRRRGGLDAHLDHSVSRPSRGRSGAPRPGGGDIYVYGSLTVARSLLAANLVDELVLMIEPITLGGGKTLFPTDGVARAFELTSVETAKTGVLVCRYHPVSAD